MQAMLGNLRERWAAYQPSKTQTFWIAAIAVVATLVIGFGPGGWVTAGTAEERVAAAAQTARHELAAAVCAEEFLDAAGAAARLAKLKEATWYDRDDIVNAGGFATMPDEKEPNIVVANMCAEVLAAREAPPVAKATPTALDAPAK